MTDDDRLAEIDRSVCVRCGLQCGLGLWNQTADELMRIAIAVLFDRYPHHPIANQSNHESHRFAAVAASAEKWRKPRERKRHGNTASVTATESNRECEDGRDELLSRRSEGSA